MKRAIKNAFCGRIFFALIILTTTFVTSDGKTYRFKTNVSGACPIRVYVNGNTYWICTGSDSFTLNLSGSNNSYSAIDAFGQNISAEKFPMEDGSVNVVFGSYGWSNHGRKRIYSYQNGSIVNLESGSSSSPSSSYSDNEGSNSDSHSSFASETGAAVGAAVGSAVGSAMAYGVYTALTDGAGETYPNLQLQVGASHVYSEFARVKWMLGGAWGFGLTMYGGIGKELFFDVKNPAMRSPDWEWDYSKKHIPWHAGLGAFYSPDGEDGCGTNDITVGLTFTETAVIEHYALMLDVTWTKFFGDKRRFGVFVGGGIGGGDTSKEDPELMWDLNVGFTFKLWQHN